MARVATTTKPATTTQTGTSKPQSLPSSRPAQIMLGIAIALAGGTALAIPLAFQFASELVPDGAGSTILVGALVTCVSLGLAFWIARTTAKGAPELPATQTITAGLGNEHGLDASEILTQSFEYARETAGQAMEHRMTIVNFYLLIVGGAGSVVGALLAANQGSSQLYIGAVALLWMITLIGWLTELKLIRLRAAWVDSATEMNAIKKFYLHNAKEMSKDTLASAFFFKVETIPEPHKPWNVFHYSVLLIAILDAGAFLGGFALLGLHQSAPTWIISVGAALAVMTLLGHMFMYDITLKPKLKDLPELRRKMAQAQATPVAIQPTSYQPETPNTVISSRKVFDGKLIDVQVDEVRLPSGKTAQREIVRHGPAVVIAAYLNASDEFLFITQYRDAIGQTLLEVPAGMIDAGETPDVAARRELREETGYEAGSLRYLGQYYTSPGFTDELHHLYLATTLQRVSDIEDTDEIASVQRLSRAEALAQARRGDFHDGKSALALLWADSFLATQV